MEVCLSNDDKISILESSREVTVDTEGVDRMAGFSFAVDGFRTGFYLPYNHHQGNLNENQRQKVAKLLSSRDWLNGHNMMHDLAVFKREGFDLDKVWFWDSMLLEHWLDEEWYDFGLSAVSKKHGHGAKAMPSQMSMLIESDGWDAVPVAWMDEYSSNDSYISHRTVRDQIPEWQKEFPISLWEREQEFIRFVIMPMKERGIRIDIPFCVKEYMRGRGVMQDCVRELGFKPSSPKALEKFLIDEQQLPVVKHTKACKLCYPISRKIPSKPVHTHTARPSFDKDAMAEYEIMLEKKEDHRAQTILRYRGWGKTTSSNYKPYMEFVDSEGFLHPGYNLHRTKTSRLSCSDPNFQQIPKASEKDWNGDLKKAFIPRQGFGLWTVDYSQLQFRMTVCMAVKATGGPLELLEIFNDRARDIFNEMAGQMGWLRDDVKTLVYLILFGGGAKRASISFGVSIPQGKELVEEFHALYPGIRILSNQAAKAAKKQRYVRFWTGRRRHFGALTPHYRALNAVIQGGEAEIIKSAMIELAKTVCDENCHMVLQIHDEIAFEIKEGMEDHYLPRIQKVMEDAAKQFSDYVGVEIDFKTSVGKWGEK